MGMYNNVIELVKEAVLAQPYFAFLCGSPSDVNQQFDEAFAFPLGFLYYPTSSVTFNDAYADFESFGLTIELIDLDEIESSTEETKLTVIDAMYENAKNVIGYLNQYNQGKDLFTLSNVTINPLPRVRTNNRVTSGVRIDLRFEPEPSFSECYL